MKSQGLDAGNSLLDWSFANAPRFDETLEISGDKNWDAGYRADKPAAAREAVSENSMTQHLQNLQLWRRQLRLAMGFFLVTLPVFYLQSAPSLPILGFGALCLGFLMVFQIVHRVLNTAFDVARTAVCLHDLSTTDVVTGGYNRLHMEKSLEHEIARAARGGHPLSLVAFDLDNFKAVNDLCGHAQGDEVLRVVYGAARDMVRRGDIVGRYGGDEFLVVLPETDAEAAFHLALRLQRAVKTNLQHRFEKQSPQSRVTLSMGVATVQNEIVSVEEFVNLADGRLYAAKRDGKNCIKEMWWK